MIFATRLALSLLLALAASQTSFHSPIAIGPLYGGIQ